MNIQKISVFYLLFFLIAAFSPGSVFALDDEERDSQRREQHFIHFRYGPKVAHTSTKGGNYTSHAKPHTPTGIQIKNGQSNIKNTLKSMEGKSLTVADTLKVYAAAGEGGFHAVHGSIGEGDISSDVSRELGLGRKKFHDEVLIDLAIEIKAKTNGLGINDFGSGADPAKINAKGDIDFTLYAKNTGVEAQWLVDQYNKIFRKLAKSRYGVDLTPGQMDIVAHRYDATIPDWRARESVADFEVKLRTGSKLLRANPEAYFLEGAYLQQIMGRSTKHGKKTFTWLTPDKSAKNGIKIININAVQVPQFFYAPKARKALGLGGAVGNYHFHHAHSSDFTAKTKYILRSLDNGPGLLMTGKRGDYQDIGNNTDITQGKEDYYGKQERRQIIDDLYNAPQMKYSKPLRDEIFEVYESCRKVRIAKDKGIKLTEADIYAGLAEHHKKISLMEIDNATAMKLAKKTFRSTSELILTSNVIRTTKTRMRDWLRPHTLKERVSYEDENGNIISVRANKADLKKLQFAAFREIHDAIQILQQDKKHHVIELLKKQNPILKKDIEIIENIIKKKREMMLAPPKDDPEAAMSYRQKAAQAVIDSWDQMGKHAQDSSLWQSSVKNAKNAWATGQALESYIYSNLTSAIVFGSGKKYGPVLEQMRQATEETNKRIMNPVWMTRISRANSVVHILTLYVNEGSFNETVIKEAIIEGLSHFPLIGMPIDIYRGTVSGLLNYKGGATGLVKVAAGSGLGQIVMSQFIPGYGPVILVLNTAKGVVNLGGTVLFTPLKNQRIKLAYQGYLDPVDIEPGSSLYKYFLEWTGMSGVRNAAAWWMDSTGRKDRIYSPRPSVLHMIDPGMKMSTRQRREAVLTHFQPKILALFQQHYGGGATVKDQTHLYSAYESDFLPKIMYKHVHEWWEGKGVFSAYDSLAVKRMMDEYYSKEMKSKLTHMLISDYIAGKGELINKENELYQSLKNLYAAAAGYSKAFMRIYIKYNPSISSAHKNAAMQILGLEQQAAEHITPRIKIISSPKIIMGKDKEGNRTAVIERINIRAKVLASDTKEHPAPFSIKFKIKSAGHAKGLKEKEKFSFKIKPDKVPESLTLTAIAYDANNKPFHEHDVTIPIIQKQTTTAYDGGESMEEVFDRLEELAQKAEEMADITVENSSRAEDKLQKASLALNTLNTTKDRVKHNLPIADRHIQEISTLTRSGDKKVSSANKSARNLNQSVLQARELSQEICQSLQEIEEEPSRRAAILNSNSSKRSTLHSMLSTGRKDQKSYISSIKNIRTAIKNIKKRHSDINKIIDPEKDRLDEGKVLDNLIEADIAGMAAEDSLSTIEDIIIDAKIEHSKGKELIQSEAYESDRQKLQQRLDKLMDRIKKANEKAENIVVPFRGKVEKLNRQIQSMGQQIESVNKKIDNILKKTRNIITSQKKLIKKSDTLQNNQKNVDDDLTKLETAALDADVCSESAQSMAQEQGNSECDEITMALNEAFKKRDTRTYKSLLSRYKNCKQYERAQGIYHNMIQTNQKCNEITAQLNEAKKKGDSQTYGYLLNQYRECDHYADAQSAYNNMIRTNERCNDIARQLDQAQRRGDIRTFRSLLDRFKGCNHYNAAFSHYNTMVQNANNQRCNTLLNQLNDAQKRRDVRAYNSLLSQAKGCSFYHQALGIYNGMKNQQNLQAFNNFLGGMMQIMNQPAGGRNPTRPPSRPPGNTRPPSRNNPPTTAGGGGGMSQVDCEKKFCPVCATGGSIDLIGVSVNTQCNDCRKRFKKKIEDCQRGGVSANRPDVSMSRFKKYQVLKCKVPVRDYTGRITGFREFYEFSGPSRKRPEKTDCTVVGNGTWDECIDQAHYYNKKFNTRHNVMP